MSYTKAEKRALMSQKKLEAAKLAEEKKSNKTSKKETTSKLTESTE